MRRGYTSLPAALAIAALHRIYTEAPVRVEDAQTEQAQPEPEPDPVPETRQQRRARERREAKAARRTEGRKP